MRLLAPVNSVEVVAPGLAAVLGNLPMLAHAAVRVGCPYKTVGDLGTALDGPVSDKNHAAVDDAAGHLEDGSAIADPELLPAFFLDVIDIETFPGCSACVRPILQDANTLCDTLNVAQPLSLTLRAEDIPITEPEIELM